MDTSMHLLGVKNARAAAVVTLVSFVGYVAVPSVLRPVVVVVMVASAVAVVVCATAWMRTPLGSRGIGTTAVVSALGLLGAVAYLHSVADEPAAIPVVGVLVLLVSLVGLVVSALSLRDY
jgi:hypothetical protein